MSFDSKLTGKASRTLVDIVRLAEGFNMRSQSEPGKLDIKRREPGILYKLTKLIPSLNLQI